MVKEENSMEIIGKNLQSTEKRERQKALKDLIEIVAKEDISQEEIIEFYDQVYLQLLKCYSDRFESFRELSCEAVSEFLKKLPRNDYYLHHIVSTIAARIGQKEQIEESEEIRAMLVSQLRELIEKFARKSESEDLILKSYNEIIDILKKVLTDPYSNVQKEACNCINILAEATPSFHYRAEVLAKPLIYMLHHKHSANRMSAIKALGTVALHITSNSECILEIITEISPLLMDPIPIVRRECGRVGCRWLLELRDRYSFFDRILPLVLCSLHDESQEVREEIQELWRQCGRKYHEENEQELNKFEIVDRDIPPTYPKNVERPTLGCRFLTKRGLKMVKLVLKEVCDWKEEVRLHSLKLLWQVVLHAEVDITSFFPEMYPVLARVCADEDRRVAAQAIKVSELIGALLDFKDWYEHAIDGLKTNAKVGYLKCFSALYASCEDASHDNHEEISQLLSQKEYANNLKASFQEVLLNLAELILYKFTKKSTDIVTSLNKLNLDPSYKFIKHSYYTLVKILCLSYDDLEKEQIHKHCQKVIDALAKYTNTNIDDLHEKYLDVVILETLDGLDANLSDTDEPILLLYGIICICGIRQAYLESLEKCIKVVWNYDVPQAKIKIFTAISVAMLKWNHIMGSSDNQIEYLKSFVNNIIAPHLVWKPGAVAESMRSLATGSLCSLSQSTDDAKIVFEEHISHFSGLVEDNRISTRVYALRCVAAFPPINAKYFQSLAYGVLQRLDDPSADVREWAARVVPKIKIDTTGSVDLAMWETFLMNAFSALFLHADGPEIKLTNVLKDSLVEMGKQHKELFQQALKQANVNKNNSDLRDIIAKVDESIES